MRRAFLFFCRRCCLAAVSFIFFLAVRSSWADETQRRLEEETRLVLASTETEQSGKLRPVLDYGGWTQWRYIDYHDDDNDSGAADEIDRIMWLDSRFWVKAVLQPDPATDRYRYSLYLRLKNLYSDSQPKATAGGSDNDGPHADYAYAVADLAPWKIRVGRQYFSVGQGIAYSDVDDGVAVFLSREPWDIQAFWSRTLPHEDNIDTSVPGFDKESDRRFCGLQASYGGWRGHSLYAFGVWQRDKSVDQPADPAQSYRYDSGYAGIGARGALKKIVAYWWESIYETGRGFLSGTNTQADVESLAHVVAVSCAPDVAGKPSFYVKGAYGSGDADRASVTDTVNGNMSGKDRNFLYFGYLPTGYAFAPRLSNMYFFKAGATCVPFEKNRRLEKFDLAFDYYRYFKARAAGGVYDAQATQANADLGVEFDVTVNWRVFSDFFVSLQYGHFVPGRAFPVTTDDNEDFLSVSTSLSF